MLKYFCVSDIHSYYDALIAALTSKGFDIYNDEHILIICGDAFDRGDDTIEVFKFIKYLNSRNRLIYIKGNHEDLLFDCIEELSKYGEISNHHYSNKTVKTLSHFIDEDDFWLYSTYIPTNVINKIIDGTEEVRDFIQQNCVDYFQLGNKIFVHSWIPKEDIWNQKTEDTLNLTENTPNYNQSWKEARWGNPFESYKYGWQPENSCIVFGHWHTSWYWSHVKMDRKEWPQKNRVDWLKSFDPVIEDKIIGLDGCVAYSGRINCIVFDENGGIIE